MARARRILTKRVSTTGEPNPRSLTVNPWPRKTQVSRPRKSVRTLIKQNPADALSLGDAKTIVRDPTTGMLPAGTTPNGRTSGAVSIVKKQNLTPRPAKGTKVVRTPSPTNRGGVRNLFGKRGI